MRECAQRLPIKSVRCPDSRVVDIRNRQTRCRLLLTTSDGAPHAMPRATFKSRTGMHLRARGVGFDLETVSRRETAQIARSARFVKPKTRVVRRLFPMQE